MKIENEPVQKLLLEIGARAYKTILRTAELKGKHIQYVSDVASLGKMSLMECRNSGPKTVAAIVEALQKRGLTIVEPVQHEPIALDGVPPTLLDLAVICRDGFVAVQRRAPGLFNVFPGLQIHEPISRAFPGGKRVFVVKFATWDLGTRTQTAFLNRIQRKQHTTGEILESLKGTPWRQWEAS